MARFSIHTRRHGTIEFRISTPDYASDSAYVRVYGGSGDETYSGQQACKGGGCTGSTLSAAPATLERVARRWWAARLRAFRSVGL